MGLLQKIQNDLKDGMRAYDELRVSVLRMLISAVKNRSIEKRVKSGTEDLTDEEVIQTIRSETKKRKDAIEGFSKGGREDRAEKERHELEILGRYLPAGMNDADLEHLVRNVVAAFGGVTMKDFGKIMGEIMKRVQGQVSGDRVSGILKKILQ